MTVAFKNLTIVTEAYDKDKCDSLFFIFKSIVFSSIDTQRNKTKKQPKLDSIIISFLKRKPLT